MADSNYLVWSEDDTDQTKKKVKLSDNGDDTYSISSSLYGVDIEENALSVHIKTIHTNMVNETMHFETSTFSLFASPILAQSRSFDVVSSAGFTIGDRIQIEDGIVESNYPTITNIVGNTITINRPLDKDYGITDGIRLIIVNMAVDGSVTPVSFKAVGEVTTSIMHITRFLFQMVHGTSGDMGLFGNLDPLEKGVLVRAFYKRTNGYKTVSLWKTNADIAIDMYDVRFDTRSSGGGSFGTAGRWTLTNAGVVAELFPPTIEDPRIDFIEILIQDDLTGLDSFTMNAQGHTED